MLVAIIMAGGSGERFWPLSTPKKPKQLLSLFSNKSMIRETIDRILPIIELSNIFIATNILQFNEIKKELPFLPEENIIVEPLFKDTAAAIGYTSLIVQERYKEKKEDIEVVVLASDHLIKDEENFRKIILKASKEARENFSIVTLGIEPTKPETGYGYIEVDSDLLILNEIYRIKKFREKPNKETAEEFVASKRYLWNSGIFIFTIKTIFKNFEVLMPEHMKILSEIKKELSNNKIGLDLSNSVIKFFNKFEKISIDFGIMEFSKNIKVIPISIGWNDIGSFTALEEVFDSDEYGNIIKAEKTVIHESANNIIISDDSIISLLGIKNVIVVKMVIIF